MACIIVADWYYGTVTLLHTICWSSMVGYTPTYIADAANVNRSRHPMALANAQSQRLHAGNSARRMAMRPLVAARPARKAQAVRAQAAATHAAKIIDGKKIAEEVRAEIAAEVAELKAKTGKVC